MSKTNPNEPINLNGSGAWNDENQHTHSGRGLTKREYFAAMAMQGYIASLGEGETWRMDRLGAESVLAADALIKALNAEVAPIEEPNHRVHFTGGVYTVERKDGEKWVRVADFADIHEVTKHYPNAIPKTGGMK